MVYLDFCNFYLKKAKFKLKKSYQLFNSNYFCAPRVLLFTYSNIVSDMIRLVS